MLTTLAIDCATEACSVALFAGEEMIAGDYDVLGRGHAERLVPMIAALPGKGQAQRIIVSKGPGSFTGVRIGIAAAQALGLAWAAQVQAYPTLALIAAMARSDRLTDSEPQPVTVCMTGGHGEWFVQDFGPDGLPEGALASLEPAAAAARGCHAHIAGSKAGELAALLPERSFHVAPLLPDARRALLLPPALLTSNLVPAYGRAPDARPTAPKQAEARA